jgi:hypothetical protein
MLRIFSLAALACGALVPGCSSNQPVGCPVQIPIGARGGCNYPETSISRSYRYMCDYQLPCGEIATCTCVPDAAKWYCNVDCPDAQARGCELNPGAYVCQSCSGYPSAEACLTAESKTHG